MELKKMNDEAAVKEEAERVECKTLLNRALKNYASAVDAQKRGLVADISQYENAVFQAFKEDKRWL